MASKKNKRQLADGGAVGNFIRQLNPIPYQALPETIPIQDNRSIRATTNKPINPNRDLKTGIYDTYPIVETIRVAKENNIDPYTLLAVSLAESGFDKFGENNPGHIDYSQHNFDYDHNPYEVFAEIFRDKTDEARKAGVTDEAHIIQRYNGTGVLRPSTEARYHGFQARSFYGVPIPPEGINMKENPLYGKEIINLRDSVIKQNPAIRTLVESYEQGGTVMKKKKITIQGLPKFKDGGLLPNPDFIQVEDNNVKPLSHSFIQITGDSHKKGGEKVLTQGQVIEAEGGEPVSKNLEGDTVFWGKMKNPITGKSFRNDAQDLAKEENKATKQLNQATELILNKDPEKKFDYLSFSAGRVKQDAANQKLKDMSERKELYGDVQQMMLDYSHENNIDPKNFYKEMENGGKVKKKKVTITGIAQDGRTVSAAQNFINNFLATPIPSNVTIPVGPTQPTFTPSLNSLAARNNNPGNLRYIGQEGATKGDKGFARFDSYESGMRALENDLRAKQTGKSKTGLKPTSTLQELINIYAPKEDNNDPQAYANFLAQQLGVSVDTPISQLNTSQLALGIARFEDTAYASSQGNTSVSPNPTEPKKSIQQTLQESPPPTRVDIQPIDTGIGVQPIATIEPTANVEPISQERISEAARAQPQDPTQPQPIPSLADRNRLNPLDFLPEIAAIFDRPDYVEGQQFNPVLNTPYRVSYQDMINQNQANFNRISNASDNPEAMATLAGQLYDANQRVYGEEFRQNQQIANTVANQNVGILNQAQLQNIQLADQQYVRQAQAQANTEANRNAALASISNKYAQHRAQNNDIRMIENLFNYRPDENMQLQNYNALVTFNTQGTQTTPLTEDQLKAQQERYRMETQKARAERARTQALSNWFGRRGR